MTLPPARNRPMALLAHLTSFDYPSLAMAFAAGLAVGLGAAWKLMSRRGH